MIIKTKSNAWLTLGIKTSCKHKRDLYLLSRNSNDSKLKNYYKLYCKVLSDVKQAEKYHCNRLRIQITKWNSIKSEIGKEVKNEDMHQLNIDRNTTYDCWVISDSFNIHFISVVEKINNATVKSISNPLDYLSHAFNSPFANIKYKFLSTKEIEKIIKSVK